MVNKQVFELTQNGVDELNKELAYLKNDARPANIEALKEARAQGDLSENADYDAAREEQGRIESRILEIENILKNVKIIVKDSSDKVSAGKHVTINFLASNKTNVYEVVGTIEADPFNGKISVDSPLGKAIFGRSLGETVTVVTETGNEFKVKIAKVE